MSYGIQLSRCLIARHTNGLPRLCLTRRFTTANSRMGPFNFQTFGNIIDGKSRLSSQFYYGENPQNGNPLWPLPKATQEDVEDAVAAAKRAAPAWQILQLEKRAELVKAFAEELENYKNDFVDLLMIETGKPRYIANAELDEVIQQLIYHANLKLPEIIEKDEQRTIVTRYIPYGVTAAICPWNFPLILANSKLAPSIIAGNCIIVKPSPFTSYSVLKMVELAQRHFPTGVVQALGGGDELGPSLVDHPGISKIAFTGSISTGKKIMANAAKTLKRLSLELGGNNPSIIFPDINIEKTAREVAIGAFTNTGQVCVATKRIYVHEDIYESFLASFVAAVKEMKVGLTGDPGTFLGPVQNKLQYQVVRGFIEDSKANGYRFALGNPHELSSKGYFINPIVIDNPPDNSKIVREEPFGPIVPLIKWSSEEEVIRRANDTNTGLGACVWTKDLEHACRVARRIEAGSVWINSYEKLAKEAYFSGHKESGLGGELGPQALMQWVQPHVLHIYHEKGETS